MGNLLILMGVLGSADTGPTVSPSTANNNQLNFQAICWSGVRFESSGTETGLHRDNVWHLNRNVWLDSGNAADVWVERTLNSGTFNISDPGAGRKQLNSTRTFALNRTTAGTKTVNVTFDFWDAASGGNNIGSATIQIQAVREDI